MLNTWISKIYLIVSEKGEWNEVQTNKHFLNPKCFLKSSWVKLLKHSINCSCWCHWLNPINFRGSIEGSLLYTCGTCHTYHDPRGKYLKSTEITEQKILSGKGPIRTTESNSSMKGPYRDWTHNLCIISTLLWPTELPPVWSCTMAPLPGSALEKSLTATHHTAPPALPALLAGGGEVMLSGACSPVDWSWMGQKASDHCWIPEPLPRHMAVQGLTKAEIKPRLSA